VFDYNNVICAVVYRVEQSRTRCSRVVVA
jgi:hypothetical protein